ncbi:unnamed protein product [Rotaria sp. Silwood2]|nr:unnamed protein product [Rotaria sp. Silwood2]
MIIRSEAAVLFASIVLKALSEKIQTLWPTIVDTEWLSFCEGLAVLYCMKVLWHQDSEEKENVSFNLLSMIPDNGRQQEVATKLLSLLSEFRWVPKKNQEMALYKLINRDHLTLEHLEVAASFETYTSYLTQFVIAHQKDGNELQENIQIQLNKLLKENHFSFELADIVFVLNYMKTQTNEIHDGTTTAVIKLVISIFEKNDLLWDTIIRILNEKNYHISSDEFPLIQNIIFHSYNPYFLHGINLQEYLKRMLSRRDDRTIDYFIEWFRYFLCDSIPDWLDSQSLLNDWTECFVSKKDLFLKIIEKIDALIGLWTDAAPQNNQRSLFFLKHMVAQCFRQGKHDCKLTMIYPNTLDSMNYSLKIHSSKPFFASHRADRWL